MRAQIAKAMRIRETDPLPPSHAEEVRLESKDAVRFVWESTTSESLHNLRMKNRVLADIRAAHSARTTAYKQIPDSAFAKKALDSTFESVYASLRKNFRVQQGTAR